MSHQSPQLTTELVIQSQGNLTLDMVYNPEKGPASDIYNVQPALGFYCLYRARPGQPPPIPDCENITKTATAHASLLTEAGIDYVATDVTNWPMADVGGSTDIAVLRPTEVLFEEWTALRAQGIPTPSISIWPCSPSGSTTWQYLVDTLYNNETYAPLVWRVDGKKALFVPYTQTCYDLPTIALMEANGGRNDIKVIPMWALFGDGGGPHSPWTQGVWGFFSPCVDGKGEFTTSIVGAPTPCNQFSTFVNSTSEVMEISASGGYMLSQCALPFASPGHFRGLTLARLFEKILANPPPNVFLSSWNEEIGGRQAPASPARIAFNQGLPHDPQRMSVWVDTYAAEFSRDIEPSVEGGGVVYAVAKACITLLKSGGNCTTNPTSQCCTRGDKEVFSNIWSLSRVDGGDNLLTNASGEKDALVAGGEWKEQCSPISNPTVFCVDGGEKDGSSGPFILYNAPNVPHPRGDGTPFPLTPLYRCITPASPQQTHFFSLSPSCEGGGTAESTLGYIAQTPGLETLRGLRRCLDKAGGSVKKHALDVDCDFPDPTAPNVLGYVR